MKRWTGGLLISGLAFLLLIRYDFVGKVPRKQSSAYDFFNGHSAENGNSQGKATVSSDHSDKPVSKPLNNRIKPEVVDFEGLSVLYTLGNFSIESKVLDVWRRMREILSRSDALPDTALGIKEAAVAWKQLVSTLEESKDTKLRGSSSEKDCPYYVNAFNGTGFGSKYYLDIPCGLIEDSSITLIGTPKSQASDFQIELVGSRFPEEPEPAVLLYYKVFLPRKNLTKNPFIIQNTWTKESEWGKEERCPYHSLTNSREVDGLAKCHSKSVNVPKEETVFDANSTRHTLTNHSDGGAVSSASFPFAENVPFTATLWAGLEGFHMSVNGRHETSFSYREKLEPWLVNRVKVEGGMDMMSLLANKLPVSAGLDFDVDLLKAPLISRKRLVLLIGVVSNGNNFERRMALRRTWMQYKSIRSGDVAVRFLIGLHRSEQVNHELWREAQAYGDVQLMPFVDYYSLLTLKTIALCILGIGVLPAKYIMKTDDDAFVRVDEILSSLKGKASEGLIYGQISFDSGPDRDKNSKWYISPEEWPHSSYPHWAHGPGYIISRDIAKFVVQGHRKRDLMLFKLEDVAMGIWVEQFKQQNHKVEYLSDFRFQIAGCEEDYLLAHYQNPRKLLCLWEILQKEHEAKCCE